MKFSKILALIVIALTMFAVSFQIAHAGPRVDKIRALKIRMDRIAEIQKLIPGVDGVLWTDERGDTIFRPVVRPPSPAGSCDSIAECNADTDEMCEGAG